ncbi:hypothetical protein L3X38_033399 [Prunus dulcis]|uniref:Uncharacterized protein n=1 Tax=Prunus dulcis TaxID=3755 RepID=A0AAD4VGY3_PRUDU|nr:hypothetical protein L3X38_033399 [Prunus dulcis]
MVTRKDCDVDDIPGGLLVSEGAFVPPETPQPLNDVMDQKGEGSVVIEVGLARIHECMPSVAHMGLLSDDPPDQWAKEVAEILVQSLVSVYGDSFKIEALGAFAPFVAHESRGLHVLSTRLLKCNTQRRYAMVMQFLVLILATIWAFVTKVVDLKFDLGSMIMVVLIILSCSTIWEFVTKGEAS